MPPFSLPETPSAQSSAWKPNAAFRLPSGLLRNNPEGNRNAAFGFQALDWAEGVSGNENGGIGYKAGSKTEGGAHNIDISKEGVAGEERVTRIGTESVNAKAFVAGVYKKT